MAGIDRLAPIPDLDAQRGAASGITGRGSRFGSTATSCEKVREVRSLTVAVLCRDAARVRQGFWYGGHVRSWAGRRLRAGLLAHRRQSKKRKRFFL
jgi:hypothetical protein